MSGYQVEIILAFPAFHLELVSQRMEHAFEDEDFEDEEGLGYSFLAWELLDSFLSGALRRTVQEFESAPGSNIATARWYVWTEQEGEMLMRLAEAACQAAGWVVLETSVYELSLEEVPDA